MSSPQTQITRSTSSVRTGLLCPETLPTAANDATPTPTLTPPTPLSGIPTLSPFAPIPPAILRIKRKISPLCKIKELGDSCDCKECDVTPHPFPSKRCFLCKLKTPHDDKDCCLKCGNKFVEDFFPTELYPVERTPIQSVQELVQGVPPTFVHLDPKNSRKRYCNYCKRISLYLPKELYLQCQGCHDMIPQDDFNKKKEEEVIFVKVEKRSPYFQDMPASINKLIQDRVAKVLVNKDHCFKDDPTYQRPCDCSGCMKVMNPAAYYHQNDCAALRKKDETYCDCKTKGHKNWCEFFTNNLDSCNCRQQAPQTPPFIKEERKTSPPPAPKKQRTQGKLLLLVHQALNH
jgi:hypothetical protein